ncbi:6867_t:CDS:1, partial [Rhizophagus irregularis]
IRIQPGCTQFPEVGIPSDCAFAFDTRQNLANAITVFGRNAWSNHVT